MNRSTEHGKYYFAIFSTIFLAGVIVVALLVAPGGQPTPSLPPCPTEDSDNCIWDATTHGNGQGRSFISLNGTTYYLED